MTSQHDNSSLPVSYSATVLEGGGQVCPPEEQLEMARAEITEDILNIVRNSITDVHCPGQVQENPASSCLEVSRCDPNSRQRTTGSPALMEQLFRSIATWPGSVVAAVLLLEDGLVWLTST